MASVWVAVVVALTSFFLWENKSESLSSNFIFQIAVCNLASIALNMFVNPDKTYNFQKLKEVTKVSKSTRAFLGSVVGLLTLHSQCLPVLDDRSWLCVCL